MPQLDGLSDSRRRGPISTLWLPATAGSAVTLVLLGRLLLAGPAFDHVWAEDGAIFYADAVEQGPSSLFYTYAGYAHVVPRLIALVGGVLPQTAYAALAVASSLAVTGLLAAFVQYAALRLTDSIPASLVAGSAFALTPALRVEVLGNLANLQWFFLVAATWAVTLPVSSQAKTERLAVTVVTLATGLTTPLAAVALPIAVVLHGRTALVHPACRGILGGLAGQAVLIVFGSPSTPNPFPREPAIHISFAKTFITDALGPASGSTLLAALLGAAVLVSATWLCVRSDARKQALCMASAGAILFSLTSVASGNPAPRYSAVAGMLLVSAVAVAWGGRRSVPAAAVLMLFLFGAISAFPVSQYRLSGPSWSKQVASCSSEFTSVRLSPEDWPLTAPCRDDN